MRPSFVNLVTGLLTLSAVTNALPSTSLVKRTASTSAPSGCLTVRGSGTASGEYSNLIDAVAELGTGNSSTTACIFIYSGTYFTDQVYINYKGNLTLYGYTTDTGTYKASVVIFQRSINSATAGSLDASATLNVVSANFKAYNIDVKSRHYMTPICLYAIQFRLKN